MGRYQWPQASSLGSPCKAQGSSAGMYRYFHSLQRVSNGLVQLSNGLVTVLYPSILAQYTQVSTASTPPSDEPRPCSLHVYPTYYNVSSSPYDVGCQVCSGACPWPRSIDAMTRAPGDDAATCLPNAMTSPRLPPTSVSRDQIRPSSIYKAARPLCLSSSKTLRLPPPTQPPSPHHPTSILL